MDHQPQIRRIDRGPECPASDSPMSVWYLARRPRWFHQWLVNGELEWLISNEYDDNNELLRIISQHKQFQKPFGRWCCMKMERTRSLFGFGLGVSCSFLAYVCLRCVVHVVHDDNKLQWASHINQAHRIDGKSPLGMDYWYGSTIRFFGRSPSAEVWSLRRGAPESRVACCDQWLKMGTGTNMSTEPIKSQATISRVLSYPCWCLADCYCY